MDYVLQMLLKYYILVCEIPLHCFIIIVIVLKYVLCVLNINVGIISIQLIVTLILGYVKSIFILIHLFIDLNCYFSMALL